MTDANDDEACLAPSSYPLIVYIHVPKTAGTTVKRTLFLCTPRGHGNVEHLLNDLTVFGDVARASDWLAGHTARDLVAQGLVWIDRPIEYFATVRDPLAQLVSHLNWSLEKLYRPNYYGLHRELQEQQLDAEVMSTDFSQPASVVQLLLRHAGHYLNIQSRYLVGPDFAKISNNELARRLASYVYVASDDDLPKLYRAFGFAQLPEKAGQIVENASTLRFDPRVFKTPQLQEFLEIHHKHDLRLYAAVRSTSWAAEGRPPFRPVFVEREVFTFENFDEQCYLASNLDVAIAVRKGECVSGRVHFENCGYRESRMLRRWIFPQTSMTKIHVAQRNICASSAITALQQLRDRHARLSTLADL